MASEPPTLGELVRQLETVARQLQDITLQLRTDFVRKETYELTERSRDREFRELRGDIEELKTARAGDQSWRRQMSLTLAIAVIGWLLTIALAVATLMART